MDARRAARRAGSGSCNLHASTRAAAGDGAGRGPSRAARRRRARWAGGAPLVLGGDLNLREPELPGLRHVAGHYVDHVFVSGLEPAGRGEVLDRGTLSDHQPVAVEQLGRRDRHSIGGAADCRRDFDSRHLAFVARSRAASAAPAGRPCRAREHAELHRRRRGRRRTPARAAAAPRAARRRRPRARPRSGRSGRCCRAARGACRAACTARTRRRRRRGARRSR